MLYGLERLKSTIKDLLCFFPPFSKWKNVRKKQRKPFSYLHLATKWAPSVHLSTVVSADQAGVEASMAVC